jgi:hypothetical protein
MSRKTLSIEVEELTEVDVEGIALVKRGANRIPFRIIKREEGEDKSMNFNIKDLFKSAEVQPKVPTIVGVILNKAAPIEGYRKAIEDAGHTILDSHDIADSDTLFLKMAEGMDDVAADVLKINDDMALVITGLKKALVDVPDTNSFMENLNKTQFFPGLGLAMGTLQETVRNIAFSEEDDGAALSLLAVALDDFKEFVVALAGAVPADVAKFEKFDIAPVKKAEAEKAPEAPEEKVEGDEPEADNAEVKKTEEVAETIAADEDEKDETPDPLVAVLEKLEQLGNLSPAIETIAADLKAQGERLEALETATTDTVKRVKKAEEDLRGTIPGGGEHSNDGTPTGSGTSEGGMFDSVLPFAAGR